jgi:hypothetical protein
LIKMNRFPRKLLPLAAGVLAALLLAGLYF